MRSWAVATGLFLLFGCLGALGGRLAAFHEADFVEGAVYRRVVAGIFLLQLPLDIGDGGFLAAWGTFRHYAASFCSMACRSFFSPHRLSNLMPISAAFAHNSARASGATVPFAAAMIAARHSFSISEGSARFTGSCRVEPRITSSSSWRDRTIIGSFPSGRTHFGYSFVSGSGALGSCSTSPFTIRGYS